ncbi:MAG: universal stress protein [Thermoleophilia bacterium]|nr:universal stress protein [Thermoleophilia bacterium]
MKQRVIIAYDGSPDGKRALTLGNLICRAFDAKPVIAYRGGVQVPEMAKGYFKNTGHKSPTRGLRMLADQVRPMAVVVGCAPSENFGRSQAGCGGKRILKGGNCPIAVAPPEARPVKGLSAICVAVDGHGGSFRAIDEASSMARFLGVGLRIVSVLASAPTSRRKIKSVRNQARANHATRILEEAANRVPGDVKVELEGLVGDPAEKLGEYSEGFDLMVVGSQAHGRLGRPLHRSVSAYLMEHSRCPVLITPEKTPDRTMAFG